MMKEEVTDLEHREDDRHIGTHIVADFWHCKYKDSAEALTKILINAAHASNATVLGSVSHQFEPEGATSLILLAESHISAHTWPEYDYIAIDIFTCGRNMEPEDAIDYLEKRLKPEKIDKRTVIRGKDKRDNKR